MDRYWLLTWTTYGTWLPGDRRGFVGRVRNASGDAEVHNTPGTSFDADLPALRDFARQALKGDPIFLSAEQADVVLGQLRETATFRHWELLAAAIMANHIHLVVGVVGDPDPARLLADFKSYASRALNRRWPTPASGTWWTASGSRRILRDDESAIIAASAYVKRQQSPLVIWTAPGF